MNILRVKLLIEKDNKDLFIILGSINESATPAGYWFARVFLCNIRSVDMRTKDVPHSVGT